MKFKTIVIAVVLCLSVVSCGDKSENSYSGSESSKATPTLPSAEAIDEVMKIPDSKTAMEDKFKDIPEVDKGPVLSISNTTAKAGEVAEFTVSVEGADLNWSNSGIHLTYPEELECVYEENDNSSLKYEVGKAAEFNTGIIVKEWKKESNPPEELLKQHLGTTFFTIMFNGNDGQDGEIIKLYLKIPDNAESGTVYPIDFYYMATDMFRNAESDMSLEKYAFEHTQAGSITVE